MNLWQGEVSVAGADTEPFAAHMFIIAVKKKMNFLSSACQFCSVVASDGACAYDGVCKLFHLFVYCPLMNDATICLNSGSSSHMKRTSMGRT